MALWAANHRCLWGDTPGLEAEAGFWQNLLRPPAVHWPGPRVGRRGLLGYLQKVLPGLKAESPTGCLSGTPGWGGAPQVLGELGRTGRFQGSARPLPLTSQELDAVPPKVGPGFYQVLKAMSEQRMAFPPPREEQTGIGTPTYGILISHLEY